MLCTAWLLLVLRGRPRHLLVAAFGFAHVAMALTVRVGAFSFVCLTGLLLFCQSTAWDDTARIGRRVRQQIARRSAVFGRFRSDAFQSAIGLLTATRSRLVTAATRAPRPTPPVPSRAAAAARSRLPPPLAANAGSFLLVAAIATLLVIAGGLSAVGALDEETPSAEVDAAASGLVSFQSDWSIFAPNPRTTDRYYVFPARTESGDWSTRTATDLSHSTARTTSSNGSTRRIASGSTPRRCAAKTARLSPNTSASISVRRIAPTASRSRTSSSTWLRNRSRERRSTTPMAGSGRSISSIDTAAGILSRSQSRRHRPDEFR